MIERKEVEFAQSEVGLKLLVGAFHHQVLGEAVEEVGQVLLQEEEEAEVPLLDGFDL